MRERGLLRVGSMANRPALILDAARVGEGYWTAVGGCLGAAFRRVIDKVLEATGVEKLGWGVVGRTGHCWRRGGSGDLSEALALPLTVWIVTVSTWCLGTSSELRV